MRSVGTDPTSYMLIGVPTCISPPHVFRYVFRFVRTNGVAGPVPMLLLRASVEVNRLKLSISVLSVVRRVIQESPLVYGGLTIVRTAVLQLDSIWPSWSTPYVPYVCCTPVIALWLLVPNGTTRLLLLLRRAYIGNLS